VLNSRHRRAHFELREVAHYLNSLCVCARKQSLEFLFLFLLVMCSCTHTGGNETRSRSFNEDTWRDLLLRHLKAAEESVDVAVHGFTDREFADCLIQVHRRGSRVRLYMDKTQMVQRVKPRTALGESGIPIRFSSEPGAIGENFCIIDGKKVMSRFPDWLSESDHQNRGHVEISNEKEIAHAYEKRFQTLWDLHFSIIYPYRF
jgi:hypothetical protein